MLEQKVRAVALANSVDVHDGRTKLVLGMIWTLILRFHLEGDENEEDLGFRSALLEWCNNVLNPQVDSMFLLL